MSGLPKRGPAVRAAGLPLPPGRMPMMRAGRPLKRWRYVGVFGPELQLCAGEAWIGPLPQRWWAIAAPGAPIRERSSVGRAGVRLRQSRISVVAPPTRIELSLDESAAAPVETLSASGERGYIWTRKRAGVPARGTVELDGSVRPLEASAVIDDSAGYHERHTSWCWSAGVGCAEGGEQVAWNLVAGVHDCPTASERSVWVEGRPHEVGVVEFADDLSWLSIEGGGELRFSAWSAREHGANLLVLRSSYRQPFGTFQGELPGGLRLADGYGVMEEHDAWW